MTSYACQILIIYAFDDFVDTWHAMGGDWITEDVNDAYYAK